MNADKTKTVRRLSDGSRLNLRVKPTSGGKPVAIGVCLRFDCGLGFSPRPGDHQPPCRQTSLRGLHVRDYPVVGATTLPFSGAAGSAA